MHHTPPLLGRIWQGLVSGPLLAACLGLMPILSAHASDPVPTAIKQTDVTIAARNVTTALDQIIIIEEDSTFDLNDNADDADADTDALSSEDEVVTVLPTEDETPEDEIAALLLSEDALSQAGNLWEHVRAGFKLDLSQDNDRIAVQRNWYAQHQPHLDRVALRASRYLYHTVTEAEQRGIPTELALLPVIESAYDPFAFSRASAAGMWQFIPGTGKIFGLKQNEWFDGRRDIIESTRAAYDFLTQLQARFGSWELALAAYNAGPGAVQRAINRNAAAGLPTDFWSLRLPSETMSYVPRFLAMAQIIKSPESLGLTLRPLINQPYFRVVGTSGQIDISAAASLAGVSLKEMYQLNPGFSRWATDPEGPHRLLIPAFLPSDFEKQISSLPAPENVVVEHYKVKRGDTLSRVAKRFSIAPSELKRLNGLKSSTLKAGATLVISQPRTGNAEFARVQNELFGKSHSVAAAQRTVSRYKVRRGDTLSTIARKHGLSTKQLANLNGLRGKTHVRLGQVLKVTTSAKRTQTASRSSGRRSTKRISYAVRKGDTLFSISKRYNVTVEQIRDWNNAHHSIRPGQGLVLHVASNERSRQSRL
ncbi:MAG: LysM peptidoglycan-binding domain-containing protein [Moraxellaceae bacterium]|nr:LysM peptidoglycan-binding domain-containing protein [Moraxellaceae bacterium]MBP8852115.1 LysM peptidoglycan-binding domain-containing protein [Moraxellaceae bacterium]MBP9730418.1 LysM peptidoglycan-binding domain-containing protein [Moraxellaceae bacterium]